MKISYNWLKEYLECDLAPEAVAEALTSIGLEVDSLEQIEEIPGGLAGVIVAEVVECVEHPDSDHLHITKLNIGEPELLQVVCGAPNVAAGQKVLLVLDGSTGQNAFQQAKEFSRATDITAMAITKLDGTAKGGVVVGVVDQFRVPVKFVGIGEGIDDLKVFNKREFADSLFSKDDIE